MTIAPRPKPSRLRRLAPLLVILALAGVVILTGLHRQLSLETLFAHRVALDGFVSHHRIAALAVYMGLYVLVTALAIPGSAILTITGGVLFGVFPATLATIVGATIGATFVFLIAKTAIGDFLLCRKDPRAAKLAEGFRQDAFNYLLFLRLVPFPFWMVNLAAALFEIPLRTFIAATVIGIIPATFAFAFFGSGIDSILAAQADTFQNCLAAGADDCQFEFDARSAVTPQLIAAVAILCLAALVPVAIKRLRGRKAEQAGGEN